MFAQYVLSIKYQGKLKALSVQHGERMTNIKRLGLIVKIVVVMFAAIENQ
jgi:hypothetical protein